MANPNPGELAKSFVVAVYDSVGGDRLKELAFVRDGEMEDIAALFVAELVPAAPGQGPGYERAPPNELPLKNCIRIVDLFSAIAERNGRSDGLRPFVPAEARTQAGQAALKDAAPAFARLAR